MIDRLGKILLLILLAATCSWANPQQSKQAGILKLKIELQEAQIESQTKNTKLAAQLSNSYEDYLLGFCLTFLINTSSNTAPTCKEYFDKLATLDPASPFVICYNSKYLGESCLNSYNSIKLTTVPDSAEISKLKTELSAVYLAENSFEKLPNAETKGALLASYEGTLPKVCAKIRFVRDRSNPNIRVREIPTSCYSLLERGNRLLPKNKLITCYIAGRVSPSCRAIANESNSTTATTKELQVF